MAAPTVPIYWGAPDVDMDFNPAAFINVSDYVTLSDFISDLKNIDNDDDRYLSILRSPRLRTDQNIDFEEKLGEFLCGIADKKKLKRAMHAMQCDIYRRNNIMNRALSHPRLLNAMARFFKIN